MGIKGSWSRSRNKDKWDKRYEEINWKCSKDAHTVKQEKRNVDSQQKIKD